MVDGSSKPRRSAGAGEADYRAGARDRLTKAFVLLRVESFGGAVYLAGRAAEGALRAVLWKNDPGVRQGKKSLDTGHDLRLLLISIKNLGLLRVGDRDAAFLNAVQAAARLWSNDLRFASSRAIAARWRRAGEFAGRRTYKQAAYDFCDACTAIVRRCEALCLNPPPRRP